MAKTDAGFPALFGALAALGVTGVARSRLDEISREADELVGMDIAQIEDRALSLTEQIDTLMGSMVPVAEKARTYLYDHRPGDGRNQRKGEFVKRQNHPATKHKEQSSSLKAMLRKAKR